jgi:hypothetical protein
VRQKAQLLLRLESMQKGAQAHSRESARLFPSTPVLSSAFVALRIAGRDGTRSMGRALASIAVQSAALALEGIHDVHGRDGLAAGVLRVRHSVADDVLEEDLQDRARLVIDQTGDTLDTTTTGQTADSRL